MSECDVVIPCRNEAPALPELLARVSADFRAIVVDNGSTDDTAEVARTAGVTVVSESTPGYGAAVHAGVCTATSDYVAVLDGDGSMDPDALVDLLADVRGGTATMAVGRRRAVGPGVWPWHARAGTALLAWLIRRRAGLPIHDLAPMRVCRRADLVALDVRDRRFGYPLELMMRAARAGWTVRERDIAYTRRTPGTRSKVSGSVRGTALTMVDFAGVLREVGR